ncbi:hypothetical protein SBOR_3135 [Sclerotinia borealis F-4128]|uniref:Uncharacterized protein n=1 Tax=Sclerotinia borealis (strain F-4128) TaxID=1432307 RepID=W9CKI7_SCLBF|nr:hypothetical protein SBOR_3135 [Sclerotinia borealis F-4128]
MVVFVDLEDDSEPSRHIGRRLTHSPHGLMGFQKPIWGGFEGANKGAKTAGGLVLEDDGRENPNKNAITEALGCYPIISVIASHIDLNTLDALSLTCRQIRVNLLQFRSKLLTSTLHCDKEEEDLDPEHALRYRARATDYYFEESVQNPYATQKLGFCARDLNCTIKPPGPVLLRHRHRRICRTCSKAPLASLVSTASSHCSSYSPSITHDYTPSLSSETIKISLCSCPTAVWLCQPCGRSLRSLDQEYEGIWKWRTRYLPSLGGLGVGIGEGNRGVPCGRGSSCLAAIEVEQETDCDAEDAREFEKHSRAGSPSSSPAGSIFRGASPNISERNLSLGPGYARHEIEGIGGVMKKKRVKMVRVGACVPEFEDEKAEGRYLVREMEGRARSWCGWCHRAVKGGDDVID